MKKIAVGMRMMICFLVFGLIFQPAYSQTRQVDEETKSKAVADAEMQAEKDISPLKWVTIGCLATVAGAIFALSQPSTSAPVEALAGKSPEYVEAYIRAYQNEIKKLQGMYATAGCFVGSALYFVGACIFFVDQLYNM